MCGIAGICGHPAADLPPVLSAMAESMVHRGPDGDGTWIDDSNALGFAHRRLAVVDLSRSGAQPMASASGRLILNYNGEIYNHRALRLQLEREHRAPVWRGHSDTEVLLAGLEAWGLETTLERLNGMFSLALWDTRQRTLVLARDRMGEKPLYFGWIAGRFAFASELKVLAQVPGWAPRMHAAAISSYLQAGYVRGAQSAVTGIFRLPPGCFLRLTLDQLGRVQSWGSLSAHVRRFWSLEAVALSGLQSPITDPEEATDALEALLRDAVELRLGADVPIGAFLSGGMDSSLVSALMQARAGQPARTFSIGFDEPALDEAAYARAVAGHIGTVHSEYYVGGQDVLDLVPLLATTFDEPFADQSQLPMLLLAKMARQEVTVALSGDGGDELFAGYGRYRSIIRLLRLLDSLPSAVRSRLVPTLDRVATTLWRIGPAWNRAGNLAQRVERLAERLAIDDVDAMRIAFLGGAGVSQLQRPAPAHDLAGCLPPHAVREPVRRLMYSDQADYLPDDILHKLDRASMAHSLETRIPFLDYRVIEFSWRLPTSMLISDGLGKRPLSRILAKHVPGALTDRPKQGFEPPMDAWLRGPLQDWADQLLAEEALRELPMVDAGAVRGLWAAHREGRRNAGQALWNLLMLSDWRRRFRATV